MKNFKLIDRYINNKMTLQERTAFEEKLANNKELAAEYKTQKFEEDALELMIENKIREKIQRLKKRGDKRQGKVFPIRRILSIAAVVTLLFVALPWWHFSNQSYYPRMAEKHYQLSKPDISPQLKGGTPALTEELSYHINLLEAGDKTERAKAIAFLQEQKPTLAIAYYYLGHVFFRENNYAAAVNNFGEFMDRTPPEKRLYQFAEFYRGLSLLGEKNIKESKLVFEKIASDDNHRFNNLARNVLKDFRE